MRASGRGQEVNAATSGSDGRVWSALEKRPMIGNKIKVSGRTIRFYRNVNRKAAEKLGYRAGETKDVPLPEEGQ